MYWMRIDRVRPDPDLIIAGALKIDRAEHQAMLDGRDLDLSPLLLRLLTTLVERPRQLITRGQIKQQLWPNSDRIDTERRLNTAMRALRAALNDEAETPTFIETVRSHGYRWIGPAPASTGRFRNRWVPVTIALAVAAILAILTFALSRQTSPTAPPAASLVRVQSALDEWRAEPDDRHRAEAEQAVAAAMQQSPDSPAVQVLQAQLALESRWDWRAADAAYSRALDLDPTNADARLGLAWLKVNRGDNAGALADANQLLQSSVLSGERRFELGWLLIRAGRPDLATIACPETVRHMNGLSCAHTAFAAVGDMAKARDAGVRLIGMRESDPALAMEIGKMPAEAGYRRFLQWRARNFLSPDASYFDRAQVLADAGLTTEAVDNLSRSVAAREPLAVKILSSPAFMSLRANPRYQALVATVRRSDG